ncbi:hypothetical protein FRC10_002848, partial [Ceratobasidium sp. 414]
AKGSGRGAGTPGRQGRVSWDGGPDLANAKVWLTDQLDLASCSQYPISDGGFGQGRQEKKNREEPRGGRASRRVVVASPASSTPKANPPITAKYK